MEKNNMVSYMGPVEFSIEIALEKIEDILEDKYNLSRPLFRIISKIKSGLGKALKKKTAEGYLFL